MTYKSIFKGRLEFGSTKSYDKVLKMFQHRVENYYKSDILLKEEEIFDESSTSLNVPRYITQGSEKSWKNTLSLLEYIAQFAVAGEFGAWMTNEGKIMHHGTVEPRSDRVAVQAYLRGRELLEEEGKESEALDALNQAIAQYQRHPHAYERRGHVNFVLRNYKDALYDFDKSISLAPNNSAAYLGRAKTKHILEDFEGAILDFEKAIKTSIPLQPIYWKARRLKGFLHLKRGEQQKALTEFKLYSRRAFRKDDSNYYWSRLVYAKYAMLLLELENYRDALATFDKALAVEGYYEISEDKLWLYRGYTAQKLKKKGFRKDWEKAATLGNVEAQKLV